MNVYPDQTLQFCLCIRNADLTSKHLAQRTDTTNCDLTIMHITNAMSGMHFLRQCLKISKEDKIKLDLFVNTNFGLEGMANI